MRYGGGFRLVAALLVIGVVAALTAGAYSAGFVAGAGTNATNVSPWVYGGAFGASHIVGLIVTILILVMMFRVMRFAFWGHAHGGWDRRGPGFTGGPGEPGGPSGPGGWGRGWHGEHWHSARQAAFDDWHRRAHGAEPPATGSTPTGEEPR
jgi:uncharacterized membrane protein